MIIGLKSGCFSILTAAHVRMFKWVKKRCDYLIVITNDDHYIKRKKNVVVLPQHERKEILESIKYIDEVHIYSGLNEHFWLSEFKKNRLKYFGENAKIIMFHSSEAIQNTFLPGRNIADKIIICPDFPLTSTSDIFDRIRGDK